MPEPFFHGGVPGLEPGDELLPGREVGVSSSGSIKMTTEYVDAFGHAARWPGGGDVYEVEPEDPQGSPHFAMWRTRRAVVTRVVSRRVTAPLPRPEVPGIPGIPLPATNPRPMPRPELHGVRPIKRRRSDGK